MFFSCLSSDPLAADTLGAHLVTNSRRNAEHPRGSTERSRSADLLRSAFKRAVWNTYDHIGLLVVTNLLWLALCLPILTAPAATAGLFSLARGIDRGDDVSVRLLLRGFRLHFLPALKIGVLDLAALLVLWVNIDFYSHLRGGGRVPGMLLAGVMVWLAAFLLLMHAHLYPLLAEGETSLRRLLRKSALLTLDNLAFTVGITLQAISVTILCVLTGAGLLLINGSLLASLLESGHSQLLDKYLPGKRPPEPETRTWRDLWRPWESDRGR
jgi:uncharacterized membrane protein YesL